MYAILPDELAASYFYFIHDLSLEASLSTFSNCFSCH